MGQEVLLSDRCCGEAGTFAVSRPDIATQVRFRKEEEIHKGIAQLTGERPRPRRQRENAHLLSRPASRDWRAMPTAPASTPTTSWSNWRG